MRVIAEGENSKLINNEDGQTGTVVEPQRTLTMELHPMKRDEMDSESQAAQINKTGGELDQDQAIYAGKAAS